MPMSLTLSAPMSAPINFSLFLGIRQQHQRDIQLHDEIIGQLNFWARSLNTCPKSCQRSVSIRQHAYLSVRWRRSVGSYGPWLAGCSEVCGRTVRLFCFCSRTKTAQCGIHFPYWHMHSRLRRGPMEAYKRDGIGSEPANVARCPPTSTGKACTIPATKLSRKLLQEEGESQVVLDRALAILKNFSLIQEEKSQQTYKIHRLARLSTQW